MKTGEIIFNELNQWVYNDENQAGDKLQVIDASNLPEIITEVVKKLNIHNVSDVVRAFEEWQKKYPLVNLEEPEWQLKKFLSEYYR